VKLRAIKRRHDAAARWRGFLLRLSPAKIAALVEISRDLMAQSTPATEDLVRRDMKSWIDFTRLDDTVQRFVPGLG
jgi:hypothetical protein